MKTQYTLHNDSDSVIISTHDSLKEAVLARHAHHERMRKLNGPYHYVLYSITASDGSDVFMDVCLIDQALYRETQTSTV